MERYFERLIESFAGVGRFVQMVSETIYLVFRSPPRWSLILDQLFQIGVTSLPVVAITGFSTGMVLAAQSFYQLADKGLASATGLFVAKSMLTEVGPVLTSFMVTGRVGSAMCAILGTMRVTEQVDALRSMAISPLRHLVVPRFIASLVSLPLLTIFSGLMGIYGGYLISTLIFGMSPQGYFDPMPSNITQFDLWTGIIKALFFAFLISTISCYKGLATKGGAIGVGRSITSSVVICYSYILILNFFLTIALNIAHIALVERILT